MKNLQTFEEFVNESTLNEAKFAPLEGDQLKFAEQINKLVFDATNKILPKLAQKYGYEFRKGSDGTYRISGYYEGKQKSIIDVYTWTVEKFRKYRIIGHAYPNPFYSNDDLVMPFQNAQTVRTEEAGEVISGWQSLAEINVKYPPIVLTQELVDAYAKFIQDVIEGAELNLKFSKESGVQAKE
jgi:hypothetical protein